MKFLAKLFLLCLTASTVHADVEIKLSVKFIHSSTGQAPRTFAGAGNVPTHTPAAFDAEVAHGNLALGNTGRGYKLRVIEYLNIQPPAPPDQAPDFWYSLDARRYRQIIEDAALADPVTWKWHGNGALNIYINDSTSGSSSFLGYGYSIALGGTVFTRGTVIHEIGHFFNLSHTHDGDPVWSPSWTPPNPLSMGLTDGDNLPETLPDHPFYNLDQLSIANYGVAYAALNPTQTLAVDNTWFNVMSYHTEDRFLEIQMDYLTMAANSDRQAVCTGRTWFVKPDGSDFLNDGLSPGTAFRSFWRGMEEMRSPNYVHLGDDVLLLHTGTYDVTNAAVLDTPGTLTAAYGPVILTLP